MVWKGRTQMRNFKINLIYLQKSTRQEQKTRLSRISTILTMKNKARQNKTMKKQDWNDDAKT